MRFMDRCNLCQPRGQIFKYYENLAYTRLCSHYTMSGSYLGSNVVSIHIDFAFTLPRQSTSKVGYDLSGTSPLTRMLERPKSKAPLPRSYLANVMKSIPSEYSSFRSIDVSHGMCQRGSCLWSRSGSNPHIAFTSQNLTHLLGSKLPGGGGT